MPKCEMCDVERAALYVAPHSNPDHGIACCPECYCKSHEMV
jgi:hypothetical protein